MGRIRTIKPEFPQSESMGRVSRAARLCFIMPWTMADDEGRLRAASRMLASLLFPYDDDAPELIDEWLDELDRRDCITRYVVGGSTYIEITNWLEHQKIDHPKESKLPPPSEGSRIVANVREESLRTKEGTKDQGRDQGPAEERQWVKRASLEGGVSKTVCQHQVLIRIFKWVCVKHGITPAALMGPHRQRHLVIAREEFCKRAWATQMFSAPEIGYAINRHQTTVMYHCGLLKGPVPAWKRAA